MQHPAAHAVPILTVAAALGLEVSGRMARCFNGAGHKSGSDRKPALMLQTDVNRYKCHVCGVRGDAISLVRQVRNATFTEAVDFLMTLASDNGSSVKHVPTPISASSHTPSDNDKEVLTRLFELTYKVEPDFPAGEYLRHRGIDLELANAFGVGELDDAASDWHSLTNEFGIERLRAAGLVSSKGQFLFSRHRLLFFYRDGDQPVFVQGRDTTGKAQCKELSLAGLRCPAPYNVDVLKREREHVLVCEGCVDTLSAAQLGYAAVGVLGVAGFREEWFRLFRDVNRVTVLFDNDPAGQQAALELRAQFRLRRIRADVELPKHGKDLNDLLNSLKKGASL